MSVLTTLFLCVSTLACQRPVVSFAVDGDGPVRFGYPVPAKALEAGLRLEPARDGAALQWSPLHEHADPETGRVWVAFSIVGARGEARIVIGGGRPTLDEAVGSVLSTSEVAVGPETETSWRWCDGSVDRAVTVRFERTVELTEDGESFGWGEAWTDWNPARVERRLRVAIRRSDLARAAILPRARRGRGARVDELLAVVRSLPVAAGRRGRGDFVRSEGRVVTNLEYDTARALLRVGLAGGEHAGARGAMRAAYEAAVHTLDRDLDPSSGLPFKHGAAHRSGRPETGHVWLRGILDVGCSFGDRRLVRHALYLGHALADACRAGRHRTGRMRDLAWPLWELEELVRFSGLEPFALVADGLARELLASWDPASGVFRAAEGASSSGAYKERCWQTLGIVVPALLAHAARRPSKRIDEAVRRTRRRLEDLLLAGRPGIPLRYWVRDGEVYGVLRRSGAAEGALLIDGLSGRAQARVLGRTSVRRALSGILDPDEDDLATRFTLLARTDWAFR